VELLRFLEKAATAPATSEGPRPATQAQTRADAPAAVESAPERLPVHDNVGVQSPPAARRST
jgi:hypothetical protein